MQAGAADGAEAKSRMDGWYTEAENWGAKQPGGAGPAGRAKPEWERPWKAKPAQRRLRQAKRKCPQLTWDKLKVMKAHPVQRERAEPGWMRLKQ